ncbi:hypothetical protein IF1G_11399 [Cordyceps javanica]|uniref:Uncharacterized protein n=1 Tax=Cordyceps javanica TaxID=43265 RepID=A0A545UKE7_9HYPO|nr:hypothetical protein IF1G_11399 [Cordyceps javanica]
MSSCNATNGIITTVRPCCEQYAGNMNDMLFPPPVGVTYTTGLSPRTIAAITLACPGRNVAPLPLMHANTIDTSTCRNASNRRNRTFCRLPSNLLRCLRCCAAPVAPPYTVCHPDPSCPKSKN